MDKSGVRGMKFKNRIIVAYIVLFAVLIGSYMLLVMKIDMGESMFGQMNQDNILIWSLVLEFFSISIAF